MLYIVKIFVFAFLVTTHSFAENESSQPPVLSPNLSYSGEKKLPAENHTNDLRPPSGCQGPLGAIGPTGPAGPFGENGLAGPTGPQGLPGITGPTGIIGSAGGIGPTGPNIPLTAFAYFSKTTNTTVTANTPFNFDFASTYNTPNITFSQLTKQFTISESGIYFVNYIVTPIADASRFVTGFAFSTLTDIDESLYKIEPTTRTSNIPVLRGQFIRFFSSGTGLFFENLSSNGTTSFDMHFNNDAGFGAFGNANVASVIFIKMD